MAVRAFSSKFHISISLFSSLLRTNRFAHQRSFTSLSTAAPAGSDPSLPFLVSEISRILSDRRSPHHDLELGLSSFSSNVSTDLVEQVLKRCKNIAFSAHRFFLWAKRIPGFEPSDDSYHIVVDILGSSGQFAILWDFLIEIRESRSSMITHELFWRVFTAYSRADLPQDAIRAFNRMGEFGMRAGVDDLDKLLHILCKRKHVAHAQQFFDKVKSGFNPSVKTYSILTRGWGVVGDSNNAQKVFDEMRERGCLIDVLAYNSLLEALCKGGKRDEAYKMFQEMGSNGVVPDADTYSIFIRSSCQENDLHTVYRVLERTKRQNLLPNVFTYNCIIKKLCKDQKVEEAYQLLDEMIERGVTPDTWSYNAIQAYHCDHSEVNSALNLVKRMDRDKCVPDKHTYNMVLKLLVRVGRFDRANEVWESMGKRGFYPSVSTYAVMIHGFCKKKWKLEEACKYFEMMIDEGIPPYIATVELLRDRLLGIGFKDQVAILGDKMKRSTSCSIQELANVMSGGKCREAQSTLKNEETELESD
ncbi:hypothetical protein IC582_017430 [Cucumis melo]|uniref:Pentatricopeptide repeat-containing protein n=3 Tax=Cucumis melo TaxID=3656 RepID=A0A5D3E1T3_CUCMM|nr:pentatricopeptide repeat-containing protein At1g52640, mitochondrial [Cucumis melo]KAA0044434.1 pentatricopeptide repeat-containing protein [Cucumis melo var. makuwa]TYK29561.1 pentatricopeptide repeat-containing protein [Cucumis melo var. makuwa]